MEFSLGLKATAVLFGLAATFLAGPTFASETTASDQASKELIKKLMEASPNDASPNQVGHRAALLITAPDNAKQTETLIGSVAWSTAKTVGGQSQAEATIDVPDAGLKLSFCVRRHSDNHIPASAIIHLRFEEQQNGALGPVKQVNVPQLRLETEGTGQPLSGAAVKVSDNVFMVGLRKGDAEQSNLNLITFRNWFDVPILFASGRAAKITFEEGVDGRSVLSEVLKR